MFYQKHFPCFAAGKPRYTVPQNILSTKKRIFLVAVPLMNQTSASDNSLVKLRFHHTLTRIAIYVKSDDNTTGKQITAFSIRGMKNGILTCHIPEDSKDKGFGWSYPTEGVSQQIYSLPHLATLVFALLLLRTTLNLSLSSFVSQLRCKGTTIFVNSKQNLSFLLQ